MKSKRGKNLNTHRLTKLRQLVGRNATKYSAGGREKRKLRREPSLPQFKCLDKGAGGSVNRERRSWRLQALGGYGCRRKTQRSGPRKRPRSLVAICFKPPSVPSVSSLVTYPISIAGASCFRA